MGSESWGEAPDHVALEFIDVDEHGEVDTVWQRGDLEAIILISYGNGMGDTLAYSVHAAYRNYTRDWAFVPDRSDALSEVEDLKGNWPWRLSTPNWADEVEVEYNSVSGGVHSFSGKVTSVSLTEIYHHHVEIDAGENKYKVKVSEPMKGGATILSYQNDRWQEIGNAGLCDLSWVDWSPSEV